MIIKTHATSDNRLILAICDDNLIGKKFEEHGKQLDLTSDYYKGETKEEEEVAKLIKIAYLINAIGKESVKFCSKQGIIDKDKIGKIKNIPYAYMTRF